MRYIVRGGRFPSQPEGDLSMEDPDVQIQWAKIKTILILAAILVVLILIALHGPRLWKTHSAEQLFRSYNQALVNKDYAAAYDLLATETRAAGSLEGFIQVQQSLIDKHGEMHGFEEKSIDTHLQDSTMIAIHASLICEKGQVPYVFLLRKKYLFWVVYGAIEE